MRCEDWTIREMNPRHRADAEEIRMRGLHLKRRNLRKIGIQEHRLRHSAALLKIAPYAKVPEFPMRMRMTVRMAAKGEGTAA